MGFLVTLIFTALALQAAESKFKLSAINMTDNTFQACSYCDARSDRAGSRATADALREYMTRDHVAITVDKGDVQVSQRFPNERIDTGHSCSKTAEARDVVAKALMLPATVDLGPEGVVYIDEIQNSIAVGTVKHAFSVDLSVRVFFGTKIWFGSCKRVGRKTCSTDGYSEGTNKISVNIAASNVLTECIGGQEHLTFNIDANVIDEADGSSYGAVQVGKKGGCSLDILGIRVGSINSKIQQYATRYVQSGNKFHELRGSRLVAELEEKLGVQLGSTVSLPINNSNGTPRTCPQGRRKRAANCVRKSCPSGFVRLGETETCQKYFGRTRPNCGLNGAGAEVYERRIGSIVLYWCHVPRV